MFSFVPCLTVVLNLLFCGVCIDFLQDAYRKIIAIFLIPFVLAFTWHVRCKILNAKCSNKATKSLRMVGPTNYRKTPQGTARHRKPPTIHRKTPTIHRKTPTRHRT